MRSTLPIPVYLLAACGTEQPIDAGLLDGPYHGTVTVTGDDCGHYSAGDTDTMTIHMVDGEPHGFFCEPADDSEVKCWVYRDLGDEECGYSAVTDLTYVPQSSTALAAVISVRLSSDMCRGCVTEYSAELDRR